MPATSFAEPKDEKPATWHWFALRGDEPRPLFAFPGIWRRYRGPIRKNGEHVEQDVFSFMTTLPNDLVGTINHERMPVLLSTDAEFDTWLTGSPEAAFSLARSYPSDEMRIVQSGLTKEDQLIATGATSRANRHLTTPDLESAADLLRDTLKGKPIPNVACLADLRRVFLTRTRGLAGVDPTPPAASGWPSKTPARRP